MAARDSSALHPIAPGGSSEELSGVQRCVPAQPTQDTGILNLALTGMRPTRRIRSQRSMERASAWTSIPLPIAAPDVVAAAYTQSFASTTATRLLVIDTASGTLQLQNPPNDGLSLAVLQPAGAVQSTL